LKAGSACHRTVCHPSSRHRGDPFQANGRRHRLRCLPLSMYLQGKSGGSGAEHVKLSLVSGSGFSSHRRGLLRERTGGPTLSRLDIQSCLRNALQFVELLMGRAPFEACQVAGWESAGSPSKTTCAPMHSRHEKLAREGFHRRQDRGSRRAPSDKRAGQLRETSASTSISNLAMAERRNSVKFRARRRQPRSVGPCDSCGRVAAAPTAPRHVPGIGRSGAVLGILPFTAPTCDV
jgi:hypothetical protein